LHNKQTPFRGQIKAPAYGRGGLQIPARPARFDYSRKQTFEDPAIHTPEERLRHFGQSDHRRIYGTDYFERLRNVGFAVEIVKHVENLTQGELMAYKVMKTEHIFIGRKADFPRHVQPPNALVR
jgi:hypothetical protein